MDRLEKLDCYNYEIEQYGISEGNYGAIRD